jgi:uncharacterized protein
LRADGRRPRRLRGGAPVRRHGAVPLPDRSRAFTPPALVGPVPFAALRAIIADGQAALAAFDRDEINGCAGKELDLQIGPRRLAFMAETFILSFSLPNFHFHAVTAYDILRSRGVPLGKRDYEGRLRTRAG